MGEIRKAQVPARERHLTAIKTRQEAAAAILCMEIPVEWGDWTTVEQEIEGAHDGSLDSSL